MSEPSRFPKETWLALIAVWSFVLLPGPACSKVAPTGTKIGVLRFDAVLELNAPILQTNIVLFARYWVGPRYYSISVVWVEPHVGSLNFPIYPISLTVHSDKQDFSMSNLVHNWINSTFRKPIGNRKTFQHRFNGYDIRDIRFAEQEALAGRVYMEDLNQPVEGIQGDWKILRLTDCVENKGTKRRVAILKVRQSDGRIDALNLIDEAGKLIKSMEYDYCSHDVGTVLQSQSLILPERPFTVAVAGETVQEKAGEKKYPYTEFSIFHHSGGRQCTVEYEPTNLGDKLLSLPVRITVHKRDDNSVLRSARLFNYHLLSDESIEETKRSAEQFASLDSREMKVRELLIKHWLKSPDEIHDEQIHEIEQLRTQFDERSLAAKTVGEELKRINMLLSLDLMLSDETDLNRHFRKYLEVLTENDLNYMVLVGGHHVVDTTTRWGQFPAADALLRTWVDTGISRNHVEEILTFARSEIARQRFWTIAKLLDGVVKASPGLGQRRFEAEALNCQALYGLYEIVEGRAKTKSSSGIAQAAWVRSTIGNEDLSKKLHESLATAKESFNKLKEATRREKGLSEQITGIEQKLNKAKE